jgi:O-antigen ligase
VVLALGLGALINLNPGKVELATDRYDTLRDYKSADTWSGRLELYGAAVRMIEEHPLGGVGSGNFPIISPSISKGAAGIVKNHLGSPVAHNMFLSVGSELGLAGLVLFLAVLLNTFAILRRNTQDNPLIMALSVGLCIFLVTGLALTWESAKIPYIMIGTVLSLALEPSRRVQSARPLDDS